ncbi:MAG: DinB family protein [Ignavibacteriota bacterium]
MKKDQALRDHLVAVLEGGHAHITFDKVVHGFPVERAGVRPHGVPHSAWQLLEHIRRAQEDILRFSQSADYVSPPWPEGYWPKLPEPEKAADWAASARGYRKDLAEFNAMLADPKHDLHRPFPWGDGQTLLREALTIIDHTSYHLGQLLMVRQLVEG